MQQLCYFALTFLCSLCVLSPVLSLHCNDTQYIWPVVDPRLCCNKCPPGKHSSSRRGSVCSNVCSPCTGDRFTAEWNVQLSCELCENCNRENMEYQSRCTPTQNAVCRCKAGYECNDEACKQCVPMKTITKAPLPPSTTAPKPKVFTTLRPTQPTRDTVWFLVITALLCAGLAVIVVTKIKPFMRWIKTKQGYFLAKDPASVSTCSEDEDIPTPVQEVREKCDQCDV